MWTVNDTAPLPNPDTPLAFFTPKEAYQTSVSTYGHVASLAVITWDILDTIPNDYRLLFHEKLNFPVLFYFVSRLSFFGFALSCVLFQTMPAGHCNRFEILGNIIYPISLGSTGLLCFFRLRAIYNRNKYVVGCFFILWLGLLGASVIVPIEVRGGNIGTTKYCIDTNVPTAVNASIFAPLINDTLVFIAISYRLVQISYADTLSGELKAAIFGTYLPKFTRSLLFDGQKYYLISLISNLIVVIMVLNPSIPIALRSMGAATNVVVTNIMTCRVYRRTRFGWFRETELSTTMLKVSSPLSGPIAFVAAVDTSSKQDIGTQLGADGTASASA